MHIPSHHNEVKIKSSQELEKQNGLRTCKVKITINGECLSIAMQITRLIK